MSNYPEFPFRYGTPSSDVPFDKDRHRCGVFIISDSTGERTPHNYWMEDRDLWTAGCRHFYDAGWDTFSFVPYTSRENWARFHPSYPLHSEPMVKATTADPPDNTQMHLDDANNDIGIGAGTTVTQQTTNFTPPRNTRIQAPPPPFTSPHEQPRTTQGPPQPSPTQQAPLPPQPNQPYAQSDPALIALLEQHLRSFESLENRVSQLSQTHKDLANATQTTASKITPPSFPKWDGDVSSLEIFLERIDTFKNHPYFAAIYDWTTAGINTEEALHIRTEMFDKLPQKHLSLFINDPRYKTDGIAMLHRLLARLNPNDPTNQLNNLERFANLDFPPSMTGDDLLMKGRGLAFALRNINIDQLVSMRLIKAMENEGRFDGIVNKFKDGDPTVVGCSLDHLGTLMDQEEARLRFLQSTGQPVPSANQTHKKENKKDTPGGGSGAKTRQNDSDIPPSPRHQVERGMQPARRRQTMRLLLQQGHIPSRRGMSRPRLQRESHRRRRGRRPSHHRQIRQTP